MTITDAGIAPNRGGRYRSGARYFGEIPSPPGPPNDPRKEDAPLWVCVLITLATAALFTEAVWLIVKGIQ